MRVALVYDQRKRTALAERLALLHETGLADQVETGSPGEIVARCGPGVTPYLVDVNRLTVTVALHLWRRRRPWIVDTGDDPAALARNRGARPPMVAAYRWSSRLIVRGAQAVVYRGSFHQALLTRSTAAPLHWAPDTVADEILDRVPPTMDPSVIATFGTTRMPRQGDRAYGWEVIDLVARSGGRLQGIVVAAGSGREALEARARRLGVHDRIDFHSERTPEQLVDAIAPAATVTSVQSFDAAGWVRTTGKLPLCLALGKYVLATRVGEAVRVLPDAALVGAHDDDALIDRMLCAAIEGPPAGWPAEARARAEQFRRSTVASSLAAFLDV